MTDNQDPLDALGRVLPAHYRVLEVAGRGGMATVFRARDERHERDVAVKVLHREVAGALAGERFLREIRIAAGLQHPHIVPIYDSGEAEGLLYYVMPYVEGASLRDRLEKDGALPVEEALAVAQDVGAALAYAHERGVVHRDVKPENILLAPGAALVADFGVARALSEAGGEALTATGVMVGTPTYLSPEQATTSDPVDGRSDLYGFACVVYEMLAGSPPFTGPTAWALIAKHHSDPVPPLGERRSALPPAIPAAVERALAKDPEDRFTGVSAFLDALGRPAGARGPEHAGAPGIRNLPVPPTPILGRDRERDEVAQLLARDEVRLVTLTGPGGTGKTRLALELADTLAEGFPDGVCFVPLASVTDPDLVAPALVSALQIRPGEGESVEEALVRSLGPRRVLLVLDNFEQVIAAAPVVARLLTAAPGLNLLVTSRIVLNVRGEHEFPVPPLALPDLSADPSLDTLAETPSVALFVDRARALRPGFSLDPDTAAQVARICVRLDGLPLAIELAAARTKMLSPGALLDRLERRLDLLESGARDLPDRQRTLRATIDWSHGLLAPPERKVFHRFSVFAGGASLEAAEAVCGEPGRRPGPGAGPGQEGGPERETVPDPLDLLESLVDQSLLVRDASPRGEPRLRMLETIREYALDALEEDGEVAACRRRHLHWFRELALDAEAHLTGKEQTRWLAALDLEHDNLRGAMDWSRTAPGEPVAGLEAATALWRFWLVRGHLEEGRSRLVQLLDGAGEAAPRDLRARALSAVGMLGQNLGDYEAAREALAESLDLWRVLGDERGVAAGLTRLGWVRWRQCDYVEARRLSEEALLLHRKRGDDEGEAHALMNLAWTLLFQEDPAGALELLDQALEIRKARGDRRGIAFALTLRGWSLLELGEPERARELLEEAVSLKREVGERQLLAFAQTVLAACFNEQGEGAAARSLVLDQALPTFRAVGDRWGIGLALYTLGRTHEAGGDSDRARELYRESLQIRQEMGDLHGAARSRARLEAVESRPPDQVM